MAIYLKRGLSKENKTELVTKYIGFENCVLNAPNINPEIVNSSAGNKIKRDGYQESLKNQLGMCIVAIGKAINSVRKRRQKGNALRIFKRCWEIAKRCTSAAVQDASLLCIGKFQ